MRVPLSWLYEFVQPKQTPEQLAETLTLGGLVVERVLRPSAGVRGVRVAEVLAVQPHPSSRKPLWLVQATDGEETLQVVCGANNYAAGDRVAWAKPGSELPGGLDIGRKTIADHESNGMLASARELGVGDDHRGIWVLGADAPVGADLAEWLELDDVVLELDLNPDRGYALAVMGVARDVAALTGAELTLPEVGPNPGGDPGVPVTISAPDRCRRFDGRRITGVTIKPSPPWLQRRLFAAGVRPISNVVDATNYAMLEVGNPIHAYDVALLTGPLIDVRTAAPGERLTTLDGVDRALDPDDLVIADGSGAIGLAGVMGGASTEINDATTDVFLEVANFTSRTVLRTARRHRMFTEGSRRWERHVPPESAPIAAGRCADLIVRLAGGQVTGGVDVYPDPQPPTVIALRVDRARSRLGMALDDERQAAHLRSIGCDVAGDAAGVLRVTAPAYRPDLRIEEDLYEEIARLEGYEQLPERVPATGRIGGRRPEHDAQRRVRQALAGAGWTEVAPFPFIAAGDIDALGLAPDDPRRSVVALVNPLSQEEAVLHTTLLPSLLRVVRRNVNRQSTDLALFQTGRVFLPAGPGDPADGGPTQVLLPAEPVLLGFAACGDFTPGRHDQQARPADVFDLLGAVDVVRRVTGRSALQAAPTDEMPYHPGRAARLSLDGEDVGVVGELHPRVVAAFDVPPRTLAGEVRLDVLTAGGVLAVQPQVPSTLPSLRFDVAVVVDDSVPAAAVAAAVREGAGTRVTSCELFDVFTGAQVGDGKRSLAYRLRLDDPAQTLTEADEQAAIAGVEAAVARLGGRLRR